jgi:Carboxypeptidase regulatory-like domain
MCMRPVRTVLLLLLLPAAAFAQIQSGSLVVKTTDEQGAIVPGATLTVSSPVLPAEVSGVTDASGVFHVPGLPLGTYTVKVRTPDPGSRTPV